jgi:hypothetical protein
MASCIPGERPWVTSLLVAQLFGLPDAYWAPVTTVVIEPSSLRAL